MKLNWKNLKAPFVKGTFIMTVMALPLLSSCEGTPNRNDSDANSTDTEMPEGSDTTGIGTDINSIGTDTTIIGTDTTSNGTQ
jgi:hypothetical protein